ncbi:MAG: hypothetical protein AB7L90_17675 [Hyphomicrobiaceae bacterium]
MARELLITALLVGAAGIAGRVLMVGIADLACLVAAAVARAKTYF